MKLERNNDVAVIYVDSRNNNAYNLDTIQEEAALLDEAEREGGIRAVVVTSAHPSLFCPGADLPTLFASSKEDVARFFRDIVAHIRRKFLYPKPVVYALNGHTIAGGLTMALTGDYRLLADGGFKVGMMEIDVGIAAPIAPVEMFNYVLGGHRAAQVFLAGETYTAQQSLELGLIDETVPADSLMPRAIGKARALGAKPPEAYRRLKRYLRQPVADRMADLDKAHSHDMVDQWYSVETQALLKTAVDRLTSAAKPDRT